MRELKQKESLDFETTVDGQKIVFKVAGTASDAYADAIDEARSLANKLRKKYGNGDLPYRLQRDVVRLRAVRCILGWTEYPVPYSPAAAEELLRDVPMLVGQIIAFSDADENFISMSAETS